MDIDLIIKEHFGGSTKTACSVLDVTKAAISQWRKRGVPELRQHQIVNLTRTRRKAA